MDKLFDHPPCSYMLVPVAYVYLIPMTPSNNNIVSNLPKSICRELVSHYCKLLDTKGDDFWWSCNMSELAPQHLLAPFNLDQHTITKGQVSCAY